ncbi:hypothetical protein F5Y19DRAFT_464972 [Xylariaceae sp. FL1651]|nr:hypothetical protein F5Y19DRAFT_464972 [Xylariaceae sp. FL1651]
MIQQLHYTYMLDQSPLEAYAYRKSRIVDYTLDDADLETRCPLDNGRYLLIPPQDSLGQLYMLPLELLTYVFLTLDLPSLTVFRRVNRRAMGLVNSLHQYQVVLKHCPNVLAILSIDARYFDCKTLYNTLSTTICEACDRFGSYLYLITCKRHLGLPRNKIKHLPHILSLPRKYTAFCNTLATDDSIRQLDLTTREPRRHMSIFSAPWFGSSGQSADWGFYCAGCRESKELEKNLRNKYTANGMVDHIRRYETVTMVNQRTKHIILR